MSDETKGLPPIDKKGQELKPLDLVIVGEIPEHYYSDIDPESAVVLKGYQGKYGLITYFMHEPFYYDNKNHPGWVSGDGSVVYVESHAVNAGHISTYGFWLPPSTLLKIPDNFLIMNVFSDLPWEMTDENGPGSKHFIVEGMERFHTIKRILDTPYEVLAVAHEAAVTVLNANRGGAQK